MASMSSLHVDDDDDDDCEGEEGEFKLGLNGSSSPKSISLLWLPSSSSLASSYVGKVGIGIGVGVRVRVSQLGGPWLNFPDALSSSHSRPRPCYHPNPSPKTISYLHDDHCVLDADQRLDVGTHALGILLALHVQYAGDT